MLLLSAPGVNDSPPLLGATSNGHVITSVCVCGGCVKSDTFQFLFFHSLHSQQLTTNRWKQQLHGIFEKLLLLDQQSEIIIPVAKTSYS